MQQQFIREAKEDIDLDKTKADQFLAINVYRGQRKIKPMRLRELKERIQQGKYLTGSIAVARCPYRGAGAPEVLINGQTTCTAVSQLNTVVRAVVEYYRVGSKEELALLYSQFDAGFSARNATELNNTVYARLGVNWHPRVVRLMVDALNYLRHDLHRPTGQAADRPFVVTTADVPFGNFLQELLYGSVTVGRAPSHIERNHLTNHPIVIAAMRRTYDVDPADAEAFWESVRDGEMLQASSPEYKLREYLRTHANLFGSTAGRRECFVRCIHYWNGWRQGSQAPQRYFKDSPIPEAI